MNHLTDVEGPAAPPRTNGELVFAEPWESRAFAMAVSLCDAGVFTWAEFQESLIARIARHDSSAADWCYYRHWLDALEDVLAGREALQPNEVTVRAVALSQRPFGHDHASR